MGERRDPRKTFWLAISVGNLDGTMDLTSETPEAFDTEREAIAYAKEQAAQYPSGGGMDYFVYRVEPVAHAHRGPVRITRPYAPMIGHPDI